MIQFNSSAECLPLAANQTHLWRCNFSQLEASHLEKHCLLLSPTEILKVNQFHRRRTQALATRLFVRLCLAIYAQQTPESLEFRVDENGKPHLMHQPFCFNLSHSENFALIGVAHAPLIGVDLQEVRRSRPHSALAERYFHSKEFDGLNKLPAHERNDYFFRLWTLKEAFFKALGTGIATGLDKVCFDLKTPCKKDEIYFSGTDSLCAEFSNALNQKESDWQFAQVELMENFHAAIAVQNRSPVELKWFNGNELFQRI